MKPVYQTILSGPLANCLQASLASLLEVSLEDVPNFNTYSDSEWYQAYIIWLENRGLGIVSIANTGYLAAFSNVGYHLIQAQSPRGNFRHTLVGLNGIPVYDPFPGGNCVHRGIEVYEFIFPLDIARWEEK